MGDEEEYEYDYGSDAEYDYGSDAEAEPDDNDDLIQIENLFYGNKLLIILHYCTYFL